MKRLTPLFLFCLCLLTGSLDAQKINQNTTKFSSVYTNLNKDCKTTPGENGSDGSADCRGIGGYRIFIWYSAAAEMIAAEKPNDSEHIMLNTHDISSDYSKIKLEWRMANGKPFAVIMRVFKYGEELKNEDDYWGEKIGEELKITGLKGFENIDFRVDAKTPDANAQARKLADDAYAAKK